MIDSLGAPASILLLGGTSEIGEAIVTRLAQGGRLERLVLAARPSPRRERAAERMRMLGIATVEMVDLDLAETASHSRLVDSAFSRDIDVVVLAAGVLPDQLQALADPSVAVHSAQVNYVGALSLCLLAGRALRGQGHGVLVALSSVAGERPRRANFVYGSAKAGLDAVATGLGDELVGTGASVLVVRPGFVTSKMTAGMKPAPLSRPPAAVADAVAANLTRGSRTVWVPASLRLVMIVLRHLPRAVFRRLPL